MSALPSGWRSVSLIEGADVTLGQSPPGASYNEAGDGMPFFQGKTEFTATYAEVRQYTTSGTKFAAAGDVLVSVRAPVGPTNLAPVDCAIGRGLAGLRARDGIDQRYLLWAMRATEAKLAQHGAGSTFPAVTGKQLRAHRIAIAPTLAHQRRIVDLLEDHLSRLDAAESSSKDALRRVSALSAALLQDAFTKSGEIRPLLDVASIANGQTPKGLVEILSPLQIDDAVPFFKVGDMNAADGRWMGAARFFMSRGTAAELGVHIRPVGTVLIPKRGGAIATNKKRILAFPAAYDLNTMGLVPDKFLDPSYLWHWLRTVDLGRIADGSNVPQINTGQIRDLQLPVPDLQTQHDVASRLDAVGESLTRLVGEVESALARARALRHSLLAAAFSGRLTGSASDQSVTEELIGP